MDPVQDNAVSIVTEEEIPNSSDVNRTEADKRATDSVYESQGVIGSGAYSEVVKMLNKNTNKIFARKMIRPFAMFTIDDIRNEAQAVIKLYSHGSPPNLVEIYSHGWLDGPNGLYRIDMELCACNLEQYIRNEVQISIEMRTTSCPGPFGAMGRTERGLWQKWDIMEQICEGLKYIHANNLVHRDMKPRNVLYSPAAKLWKVADFGMTAEGSSKRAVTTVYGRGTASYRAPELIKHLHYNNKVDIFALGCMCFELFNNGQKAFKDDNDISTFYSTSDRVFINPKGPRDNFGATGRTLVNRLLSGNPEQRPGTAVLCLEFSSNRWISFAMKCDEIGNKQLAIEAYQTATQLTTVDCTVWKALGDAYFEIGEYRESLKAYDSAVEIGYLDRGLMTKIKATVEALHNTEEVRVAGLAEERPDLGRFADRWLTNRERQSLWQYMTGHVWPWIMLFNVILTIWGGTLTYRMYYSGTPGIGETYMFFALAFTSFLWWCCCFACCEVRRDATSYFHLRKWAFDPARRWQQWRRIPIGWVPPLVWCVGLVLNFSPIPVLVMGFVNLIRYNVLRQDEFSVPNTEYANYSSGCTYNNGTINCQLGG